MHLMTMHMISAESSECRMVLVGGVGRRIWEEEEEKEELGGRGGGGGGGGVKLGRG